MNPCARGAAVLAVGATLGCGGPAAGPPTARWGEEVCARCGMIVSDARTAAALVRPGEAPVFFDEVGELVLSLREEPSTAGEPWVRDFRHDAWLPAAEAAFVASPALVTPMGLGVVAVDGSSTAQALAAQTGGTLWRWEGLRQRWEPAPGGAGASGDPSNDREEPRP